MNGKSSGGLDINITGVESRSRRLRNVYGGRDHMSVQFKDHIQISLLWSQ